MGNEQAKLSKEHCQLYQNFRKARKRKGQADAPREFSYSRQGKAAQ